MREGSSLRRAWQHMLLFSVHFHKVFAGSQALVIALMRTNASKYFCKVIHHRPGKSTPFLEHANTNCVQKSYRRSVHIEGPIATTCTRFASQCNSRAFFLPHPLKEIIEKNKIIKIIVLNFIFLIL